MGVRLYPNTKNPANLEKLAGVNPGTYEALMALKKDCGVDDPDNPPKDYRETESRYETFFNRMTAPGWGTHNVYELHGFLLYGWGKFSDRSGIAPGYAGSLDDRELIQRLFVENGIFADLDLCEGVHWS